MRDAIADALAKAHNVSRAGFGFNRDADAIIAALPGMVEPLVWVCRSPESCISQNPFGQYLVETCHEEGFGMRTPRDCIEDDPTFGHHNNAEDAKAAANAHHVAQVMKAFGVVV